GLAMIEGSVVLARHELHVADLELADDRAHFVHALAAHLAVFGRVGEVAGEHDEVRRLLQGIHRRDGFPERACRVGVLGWPLEAPVRVGELHEVEIAGIGCRGAAGHGGADEHDATESGKLEEFPSIHRRCHGWFLEKVAGKMSLHRVLSSTRSLYSRCRPWCGATGAAIKGPLA